MRAGEHPPVLVEVRPVGVCPAYDHPPAFGDRIGDGPQLERHAAEVVTNTQRQILVVEEQAMRSS
ncbi:hypothetical protein [Krasilnikovia sp. MM14-A1259]|uniref:hypothetical protein n=1 Tax=Krasilnikovia sp. MM14-A1259 TaxID=3373539 RepID=UPI00399CF356